MTTPGTTPDPDAGPGATLGTTPDPDAGPGATPAASDPDDSATRAEADRIREAFAREAFGVTPGPVPLAAVRRAGRSFRRRRKATFSALSALGAATVAVAVVVGAAQTGPSSSAPAPVAAPPATVTPRVPSPTSSPEPTSTPPRTPTQVRVVAPGERVDAGKGWKVWLTAGGKHWLGPDGFENSRSVTDGNIDTAAPGVSHQSTGTPEAAFHSGLYYGTRSVGGVELTGPGGERITATLLELPGRPGWGVWYAHTGPTSGDLSVAMYDRAGRLLSALPG